MSPPRRRSRKFNLPRSMVSKIVQDQDGLCGFCNAEINAGNCIVEESMSIDSVKALGPDTLRDELKEWRYRISKKKGKPAFVILHDKTIEGIVESRPSDLESLGGVSGIGPTKLRQYGDDILALVSRHPTANKSKQEETSENEFHAICESCDSSRRISVRIPRGQLEAIKGLNLSIPEAIRGGLAGVFASSGGSPNPSNPTNDIGGSGQPPMKRFDVYDEDGNFCYSFFVPTSMGHFHMKK